MDRRHQVFVSSTYKDLIEERRQVMHALLELDCIPSGMELFPAADEDAWSLIQSVIDDCDYYILILGGRYGSIATDGLSYTEREYDYAVSKKKPIITFLHESPAKLTADNCESTDEGKKALEAFRKKLEARHCKYWNGAADLGGKVSRSLIQLRKAHPSDGWIPGRFGADENLLLEMESLRGRVRELEAELANMSAGQPPGTEDMAQGSDSLSFEPNSPGMPDEVEVSWDNLLTYLGPSLIGECNEEQMEEKIQLAFLHAFPEEKRDKFTMDQIIIPYMLFDLIKVQLRALGLIAPGTKRRPVADKATYWKLTKYGEDYLLKLQAIRRESV